MNLITEIISVLNSENSLGNKRTQLRLLCKYRRKENRILLNFICDALSPYALPVRIKNDLRVLMNGSKLSDKNYQQLGKILNGSNCILFNAICSEVLWKKNHNFSDAENAVHLYWRLAKEDSLAEREFSCYAVSICRIYAKCKIDKFDYDTFFQASLDYVKANYDKADYCIAFVLEALVRCNNNRDVLKKAYCEVIDYYEKNSRPDRAIVFLDDLEEFCLFGKDRSKSAGIRKRVALNYEKQANQMDWNDPNNAHRIVHLIKNSMENWRKSKLPEAVAERKRLAKRIEPVKKLSLKAIQTIKSGKIDIGSWIDKIKKYVSNSTLEQVVYGLTKVVPLKSKVSEKKTLDDSGAIFSQFVATRKLDSQGRLKCIVPAIGGATEQQITSILEHHATEAYRFDTEFIQRYLWIAKERFKFTIDNLKFLLEDNLFVPEDRKETFLKGIVAGFELDLPLAMHLLVPQMENCVRCLAQECGAVVYKTEPDGVEACLSIENVLELEEVKESIDETILFNIKAFLTSDFGYSMRTGICHSLYSDKELQSTSGLMTWWFVFYLCCLFSPKLKERLAIQNREKLAK